MAHKHAIPSALAFYGTLLFTLFWLSLRAPGQAVADWGIDNPRVPWGQGAEGVAADGACYGMVRAKLEFHRLGLDKARGHSFTEITTPAKDPLTGRERPGDRLFVEQFAAMAQKYALRGRDYQKEVYSKTADPQAVDQSLVDHGISADNPQILILSNKQAYEHDRGDATIPAEKKTQRVAHAVLVEQREETDDVIRYLVSDPNSPRDAAGARALREIVYDKNKGSYSGLDGYDSIQHDTTTLPEQNRRWLDALIQGASEPEKQRYIPTWHNANDVPLNEEEYLKKLKGGKAKVVEPPVPSESLNTKVSALSDTVGGVRLYFDPTIVTDARYDEIRWQILGTLTEQLLDGKENFLVQAGGAEEVKAVRLSTILHDAGDAHDATLGGLTRLTGFALNRKTNEVYLLGKVEEDRPAIPLEFLTVALQTIWKRGLSPAISLDPDPEDFAGPQHVRVESVPAEYRKSAFVRTMLDADYVMKRIMLGEEQPEIDGFQSAFDLMKAHPGAPGAECSRWWLCPKETTGAEVYETTVGDLTVWYYDSDVRVLTEAMKRTQEALVGTGTKDPIAEEAARIFTDNYDLIEEQIAIMQQLHALFDTAKLAAVLRARGVHNAQLDAAANRAVATVEVPDSYQGIGPKIITAVEGDQQQFLYVSGGVQLNANLTATDIIASDEMLSEAATALADAGDEGGVLTFTVTTPDAVPLDPKSALRVNGELETNAAVDEMMHGDRQQARERIARLFADGQVSGARPYVARAWLAMVDGQYTAALKDADVAVLSEPIWRALRGRIRLLAGDRQGAMEDVQAAALANPDTGFVLMQKVWVFIHAGHWEEVGEDLAHLTKMMPGDPEIEGARQEIRLLRHLDPAGAEAYTHAILAIPLTLAFDAAKVQELMARGEDQQARDAMQEILTRPALQKPPVPDTLFLQEHFWLTFATLEARLDTPEDQQRARDYLDRISRRHPDWPIALLMRNDIEPQEALATQIARYEKAIAMPPAADPLLRELLVQHGLDLRVAEGYRLAMRALKEADTDKSLPVATVRALLDRVIARMPAGLAKHALGTVKKSLFLLEVERGEKQADKAAIARLTAQLDEEFLTLPAMPPHPNNIDLSAMEEIYLTDLARDCERELTPANTRKADRTCRLVTRVLNADWASVDDLEHAARLSLLAHTQYTVYLAARLRQLPAVKTAQEALQKEDADQDEALTALDNSTIALLASLDGRTPCTKALLRASLFALYPQILQQSENKDLIARAAHLEQQYARQLSANPTTLVEYRTLSLWFENNANALAARNIEGDLLKDMLSDYHRTSVRLREQFYGRAAQGQ